ncbi:MAG: DinB family protein [bacterium]
MDTKILQKLYGINADVMHRNIEGLSHDDSLCQPQPGGNCLNWVVGHIVVTRNLTLDLLGRERVWDESRAKPYKRYSEPIKGGSQAPNFSDIITAFDKSQEEVMAGLQQLRPEQLDQLVDDKETLREKLSLLYFHETYHLGQTAILRRLAGKAGAIK